MDTTGIASRDRDKLIVALDVPTAAHARTIVARLGDTVSFYKIGHELLFNGGLDLAIALNCGIDGAGPKRVFLDMKLLDIGNTMERSVANAARMGVDFLTIHGHDSKTVRAAVAGRAGSPLKLLAVTVLTNLDAADLAEQGTSLSPAELVLRRAKIAQDAGADGVIASGHEAAAIRAATGPDFLIVTPGIRPAGSAIGDQTRVMTPREAIVAGANHIVVGRPITASADPQEAARAILKDLQD
ncbi:MAG: orotidine-5'-phosphate decarboxylase [Hyphomicrobiaceae bacterium]|nr:orotidine-5'-phosphate decarboxylase [Hyphomicrobiaceae bacterium]